jgi:hypothetical protein
VIPIAARRRAMLASSSVDASTMREAAILGGIVRCCAATGRYNGPWISQYASDAIEGFRLRDVDATPPGPTEMLTVLEKFEGAYGRRFTP